MDYTLGLDIGIGSIGAAIIADNKVKYLGVRKFEEATLAKTPRLNRSQRRNSARKKWRKKQLRNLFSDSGILTRKEMNQQGYLCYTTDKGEIHPPVDRTVYHLRKRALHEQVSKRELLLCLYNILQARGHFNLEYIDYSKENVEFSMYRDKFYDASLQVVDFRDAQKKEINNILKYLFDEDVDKKELTSKIKSLKVVMDENEEEILRELLYLVAGYISDIKKIDETVTLGVDDKGKAKIIELKKKDDIDPFLMGFVDLYDLANLHKILKHFDYLCEVAAYKVDEFDEYVKYGVESKEFKDYTAELKDKIADKAKHLRSVKNLDNKYPNGLYVKEAVAILKNQQKYYPEITDEFVEICGSIISARIPYYIGPLNECGKNAWVTDKQGKFKYSYEYTLGKIDNNAISVSESIKKWKRGMCSHCTYLPQYYALPVGSFLGETFNIINEINILTAIGSSGEPYYLKNEDKVKIFDNLFLKQSTVKYSEVANLIGLNSYGVKNRKSEQTEFNNKYTLYLSIANILPELKINSIKELFTSKEKINKIEDVILNLNLFDEQKSKYNYFRENCGYSEEEAKALSRLNSKKTYNFSKEFIYEEPMNKNKDTLLSLLFEDNTSKYTNEQMTLINNATDKDGKHKDFIANKYELSIRKNDGNLDYNILMEGDKPVLPMPRTVVRALNECMKYYNEIIKVFGVPGRVVIETARDFPDFNVVKQKSEKTYDLAHKLYENIKKQLQEQEKKKYAVYDNLEEWDEIEKYIVKNKEKIQLYLTQMGTDLLTGKKIELDKLDNYEKDHIVPRGFGDNSLDDKMLILSSQNSKKGNRIPLEYIRSEDNLSSKNRILESEYLKRVDALYEMKLISERKYKRLTLEDSNDLEKFINRNLVDTRYIIREFMAMLNAFNKIHSYNTNVVALKSAFTAQYRSTFGINKVRDYGEQHHALDAAMVVIADKTLSAYYPNYDQRKLKKGITDNPFETYYGLIKTMSNARNDKKENLKFAGQDQNKKVTGKVDTPDEQVTKFILFAYKIAFNEKMTDVNSVINQIKNYKPFYSIKVEKNYNGKYFNKINLIKEKKSNEKSVLKILGVNKQGQNYEGVECVAVDFYKYRDKTGRQKYLALNIPKIIVDRTGQINKKQYIQLIKEYYNAPELIDETGEIKEYYFRFRGYKNDLVYKTNQNELLIFKLGSMKRKALEYKFVNIFAYNEIYELSEKIADSLISNKSLNIKTKANPHGVKFNEIDRKEIVEFITNKYWEVSNDDPRVKAAIALVKNDKGVRKCANHLAYLTLIFDRSGTPDDIVGRYRLALNSELQATGKDNDNQIIKLKYDILGIRVHKNSKGKIIIETPKEIRGAFKKINKEKFTWNLTNPDL